MSYNFRATELQKLYGHKFVYNNNVFEIQPKAVFPARSGLEAYGVKLIHTPPATSTAGTDASGNIHAFFKIFRHDIPERHERTRFLVLLGLAKGHWAFHGVPYAVFGGSEINGVKVVGHLTRFLGMQFGAPAEDFSQLKDKWDMFNPESRRAFACHLASAVDALERSGITHGDLSPNNIMIGPGPDRKLVCSLCDFDGFAHTKVHRLPRKYEKQDVRPLGSTGYQYPDLLKSIMADAANTDDRVCVRTDRFALAALICEIMVWTNNTVDELSRGELLTDDMITHRSVKSLPPALVKRFPEGFDLLHKGLNARTISDMPTPKDWLSLLNMRSVIPLPFRGHPRARINRRAAATPPYEINIVSSNNGDIGDLHPSLTALKGLRFTRSSDPTGHTLTFAFDSALPPAAIRRAGTTLVVKDQQKQGCIIYPDDTIAVGDWEIAFDDPDA